MTNSGDAAVDRRRAWLGMATLALPTFVLGLDMTVLHLAVPEISRDLAPSSSELLWIVDVYGFLIAGFLITMGTLGDRIGRRRLLLVGGAAFAAASVLASLADSALLLILARGVLGIAGATLMPSTLALIRELFPEERDRTVAISVWAMAFFGGMALGPAIGGALLEAFSWGSVFLFAVPIMLGLLVVGPRWLPEARDRDAAARLDPVSVLLSLVAIIGFMYGVKRAAEHGADLLPVAAMVGGLLVGALFLRRQARLVDPLLDLSLFRAPGLSAALGTQTLAVLALGGVQFFFGQYLQLVHGYDPLPAGLLTIPGAIAGIVGSLIAPALAARIRPAFVIAGGLSLAAIGLCAFVAIEPGTPVAWPLLAYALISFGVGPMFTICADLIVGSAPEERAGSDGALSETGNELGFALGIGLLGSAGAAVYRAAIDVPAGIPAEAARHAEDTLGGALTVAAGLPPELAAALTSDARAAFVDGMALSGAIGAVVAIGAAALIGIALRRRPAGSAGGGH